jgi:hypothetical protein
MGTTASNKIIRFTAVAVTGLIALSAYTGVVGLLGGGISFGETIDARLPFGSLILAGLCPGLAWLMDRPGSRPIRSVSDEDDDAARTRPAGLPRRAG